MARTGFAIHDPLRNPGSFLADPLRPAVYRRKPSNFASLTAMWAGGGIPGLQGMPRKKPSPVPLNDFESKRGFEKRDVCAIRYAKGYRGTSFLWHVRRTKSSQLRHAAAKLARFNRSNAPALLPEGQAPAAPGWKPEVSPGLVAPAVYGSGATAKDEHTTKEGDQR